MHAGSREDRSNERLLSVASLVEIAIKLSLGKLTISDPPEHFINEGLTQVRCTVLDLSTQHLGKLSVLPFHHRGPFDRMIIAQALVDNIDLVSIDQEFDRYGVRRSW